MQAGTSEGEVKALLDTYLKNEPRSTRCRSSLKGDASGGNGEAGGANPQQLGPQCGTLMTAVRTAGGLDALAEGGCWRPLRPSWPR